jgi:hypothetical protein
MSRLVRRRLALAVAALALLAGGTAAALGAGGGTGAKVRQHSHRAGHPSLLSVASRYLGISAVQLRAQLQSGKSLAQVAEATPGHTASGLTAALVAARSAHLSARIATVVNRRGSTRRALRKHARRSVRAAALSYLGLTRAELRSKLHGGSSLAQIADATPGRSAAGLIDRIVASVAHTGDARATKGSAGSSQAKRRARIRERVSAAVMRRHHSAAKPSR